ncbi:unnamed protein product [Enterobius vermicularis]|uniref:BHLH domain-containing protein n=1 Tax=Enterobius vermicularis TaxID=51028 RepID=A0A158QB30_ENTVE|nr:unnamed protein product [Enterobius vermicularis]
MVKSESADEESMVSSDKVSGNEEEDEFCHWSHPQRRASSSGRNAEEETQQNGGCALPANDEQAGRRMRRQIANCNERRRMQSINAGFQSLRSLLPKRDGEKMSKAAILQHTAELIQTLQAEKNRLLEEKEAAIQSKKRRLEDEEARDRGIVNELTSALERERRLRQLYEQQLRERRPASPMLSPIAVSTNQPSGISHSSIDPSVLPAPNDIPGLIQHQLLTLNGFVGTTPYLLRTQGGYGSAPLGVDRSIPTTCNSTLTTSTAMQDTHQTQQQQTSQINIDVVSRTPLLMNSTQDRSPQSLSEANLNAILEAIHHLEGGSDIVTASPPPALQQSNVLVR